MFIRQNMKIKDPPYRVNTVQMEFLASLFYKQIDIKVCIRKREPSQNTGEEN